MIKDKRPTYVLYKLHVNYNSSNGNNNKCSKIKMSCCRKSDRSSLFIPTLTSFKHFAFSQLVGWLFWVYGPLRQYFSLYRAVSQREGERRERIDESKNVQTTPTRTYCKRNRPLPYCNQNCRTPRHWKFTQHHRTTRPPPLSVKIGL